MPGRDIRLTAIGMNWNLTDHATVLRFLLIGGTTGLIYFGLTFLLVESLALNPTLSSTIAYIIAVYYNYFLHYHWTFATNAGYRQTLVKYVLTALSGIVLNALIMHFGGELLNVHYMVVQILAIGVVVCWSLCISALWVFKRE